ncbi:MAG: type VI secretion system tip protein VgrG [Sphingomonadaceae bacterium]
MTSPITGSEGAVAYTITLDGVALSDSVQIVSIETNHSTNRIPSAEIILLDGDMPNASFPVADAGNFKPGTLVVISAGYGMNLSPIYSGVVVRHSVRISGSNYARLVIECRDKALAMTVGRKNANYIDKTDSQIMSSLISGYAGLSAAVDSTAITHKNLVQYYVTDWDYMMVRAEANGLQVLVDSGKVTVAAPVTNSAPVLTLTYGMDLMEFEAEMDARSQVASVTATSWDPTTQTMWEQTAMPLTLTGQGDMTSTSLAAVLAPGDFGLQTAASLDSAALATWAKAQQTKAAMARIRGRMLFQGSALAKPGVLMTLAGVGAHFNGNVIASNVIHRIQDANWTTEVEFGMPSYWYADEHQPHFSTATVCSPGIAGLHIGLVLKLDADPEGQCRILVSMPLLKAGTGGIWARLSTFYGSDGFGAFVIPEVGDEVILGFFNNDPSCPVILGSLYSSKHRPPYELTDENNFKAFVTRSKLKVEFDDDKKVITFTTPGNNKVVISDDAKSILLQDQSNNKVELSPSGILLDSPHDITMKAVGKVSITAQEHVEVMANLDVMVSGLNINHNANIGFVAKGTATAELSAAGQTTVKGALVMIN